MPASVEIATAPMLIQYGGARSEGLSVKADGATRITDFKGTYEDFAGTAAGR